MINLYYIKGDVYVFNVDNWFELRKSHRIIGEIVGSTLFVPSLPVKLLPEEVVFLLGKNIAKLYEIEGVPNCDGVFEAELLEKQKVEYKKVRYQQLDRFLDHIVEQRRENGDETSVKDIIEEELEKSCTVDINNFIHPIFLENIHERDLKQLSVEKIHPKTNQLKIQIYSDLWSKGYYITHGHKFGGDFLVYVGDPAAYHAMFIVRCVGDSQPLSPQEIVAFGRLGTSVRKRAILASIMEGVVGYVTINWIDA
ncbi:unnamed protein product [Brassicogethes aeneus]|uniref:tRNA-intron lyase n=1 Tax=Brassicogethes aeneus TaxID=1431903 RepID=A0A9P0BL63_BRAAE|nr:unnamed protein product [Brassicogethes aeneus]